MYGYKTVLFVKLCTKRSRFKVNFTSYNVGKNSNASSDLVMIQNLNSYKKIIPTTCISMQLHRCKYVINCNTYVYNIRVDIVFGTVLGMVHESQINCYILIFIVRENVLSGSFGLYFSFLYRAPPKIPNNTTYRSERRRRRCAFCVPQRVFTSYLHTPC